MLTPFLNWINYLEEELTCMFISITAWLCTKCTSHKSEIWAAMQCNRIPKKLQPSATGISHLLSCCLCVPGMLWSLSYASHVSPAVLIKHISGRWFQLKGRLTDDTVQNNEKCLKCRGRGAGMPLALFTGDHKRDTGLPKEAASPTCLTFSSPSCIGNISVMVK